MKNYSNKKVALGNITPCLKPTLAQPSNFFLCCCELRVSNFSVHFCQTSFRSWKNLFFLLVAKKVLQNGKSVFLPSEIFLRLLPTKTRADKKNKTTLNVPTWVRLHHKVLRKWTTHFSAWWTSKKFLGARELVLTQSSCRSCEKESGRSGPGGFGCARFIKEPWHSEGPFLFRWLIFRWPRVQIDFLLHANVEDVISRHKSHWMNLNSDAVIRTMRCF